MVIVPPSIDVFSPKNQELDAGDGARDPRARPASRTATAPAALRRSCAQDGTPGRVDRRSPI